MQRETRPRPVARFRLTTVWRTHTVNGRIGGVPQFIDRSDVEETTMKWTTPRIVEIAVGLEINSYACAELK
jgi:coenzyme PQQ precursor peptide PqqA